MYSSHELNVNLYLIWYVAPAGKVDIFLLISLPQPKETFLW